MSKLIGAQDRVSELAALEEVPGRRTPHIVPWLLEAWHFPCGSMLAEKGVSAKARWRVALLSSFLIHNT